MLVPASVLHASYGSCRVLFGCSSSRAVSIESALQKLWVNPSVSMPLARLAFGFWGLRATHKAATRRQREDTLIAAA